MTESVTNQPVKADNGIKEILLGVALILVAGYCYWLFSDIEQGNSHYVNAMVLFVYKMVGKIPTVLLLVALGVWSSVVGVKGLMAQKKL